MGTQSYACFAYAAEREDKLTVLCLQLPCISLIEGADSPIYLDTVRPALQQTAALAPLARALSQ